MDTKQQHTAEPWKFRKAKTVTHIFNAARPIAKIGSGHVENPQDESNARRIVACVNACEGIDTLQLEILDVKTTLDGADELIKQRDQLKQQRDKLLAMVKTIVQSNDAPPGATIGEAKLCEFYAEAARAIIAEIENSK